MIKTPQMGVLATWMIPRSIERTREFERHGLSDLAGQKDLKDPFFAQVPEFPVLVQLRDGIQDLSGPVLLVPGK